jgi:genome maintenance exonuclease 1
MTYITNKFDYKSLNRVQTDEGRRYLSPDGEKLPSVTTILEATKSEESKNALMQWRKRVGEQKAKEITAEASGRGTRMHKFIEDYLKTGKLSEPGSNPYSIQSHKMATSIIQQGLVNCSEYWGTEISLFFPKVYAGTTDLAGIHNGAEAILDFKQTNKIKKREWIEDYFIQLAAYSECHNEIFNTSINRGVILMCSAANEYQEFIIDGNEFKKYVSLWWSRVEKYYSKFL